MSQLYLNEPPTRGKCVVRTSHGELEIELFANEAPMACESFLTHALSGYYVGCAFTRVVDNFMIQTGDPTNAGTGGESAFEGGAPFPDEFHSRLRFNARGRVAMANEGRRDSNGSQWFVTLGECEWLHRRHTIFGKVTGGTMYNAMEIGKVETDADDRPVGEPPRVLGVDVLDNPFPESVARAAAARAAREGSGGGEAEDFRKEKKPKKKLALLSFGEEAAHEERAISEMGMRGMLSSHDVGGDGALASADAEETREALERTERERAAARERRQRDGGEVDARERGRGGSWDDEDDGARDADAASFQDRMREKMLAKRREMGDANGGTREMDKELDAKREKRELKEKRRAEKRARELERREREATKLKKLGLGKRAVRDEDAALMTRGQIARTEAKARRSRTQDREKETLARLAAFNAKLPAGAAAPKPDAASAPPEETGRAGVSRFVPQGLYYMEDDDENDEDDAGDWRAHRLSFVPDSKRDDAMRRESHIDDYDVVDPLGAFGIKGDPSRPPARA